MARQGAYAELVAAQAGSIHRRLPSAMDESIRTLLREEAFEQRRHATESRSMCHADRGPALHELHWKGTVPRLIAEQTGAIVSPNGASYLYYRSRDFIGIHTDPYGCDLVVLTLLSGSVEPLHCHLHLADTPLVMAAARRARLADGGQNAREVA